MTIWKLKHLVSSYLGFFEPYFDRPFFLPSTPSVSSVPRTMWYLTPGKSFTRPPRTKTTECSWRLCPMPGIYAVTSIPVVSRTRATFRKAELGFLGVEVYTRVHTPLFWGAPLSAGVLVFFFMRFLPFLTSWLIVGILSPKSSKIDTISCLSTKWLLLYA